MIDILTRRSMLTSGAAAAVAAPWAAKTHAAGPAGGIDSYVRHHVRADLQAAARTILMAQPADPVQSSNLPTRRELMARPYPLLPEIPVERRIVPGLPGQPDVPVYVVNARPGAAPRPALLYTHGGGYVLGTAEADNRTVQGLCQALDCVAVNVDYRLAPETTFRGSVEDNYAALKWLHANAASLGADPDRIALYGGSAGGGHAALLAIAARDRGEVPVAFQCLIYPMLDDRTGTTRPTPPWLGRIIWGTRDNRYGWRSFLGVEPGSRRVPAAGVPARVASLTGLPPAFIGVGSLDLFLDEDIDYAQRLNAAGVPAELVVVPGAYHAFDFTPGAPAAEQFNALKFAAIRRAWGTG